MENQIQKTQATALPENCIMTLKEVVDFINHKRNVRKGDKSFKRHTDAMTTIEKMAETTEFGSVTQILTYNLDSMGREKSLKTLSLTKKQVGLAKIRLDNPTKKYKSANLLYLISDGEFTKIGVTTDTTFNRLKTLQTANARKLYCEFSIIVDNATKIERDLHKRYKSKRLMGEWFNLSKRDIKNIKNKLTEK